MKFADKLRSNVESHKSKQPLTDEELWKRYNSTLQMIQSELYKASKQGKTSYNFWRAPPMSFQTEAMMLQFPFQFIQRFRKRIEIELGVVIKYESPVYKIYW